MEFTEKFNIDFEANAKYDKKSYFIECNGKLLSGKTPMELKLKYQKAKIDALEFKNTIQPTLKNLKQGLL